MEQIKITVADYLVEKLNHGYPNEDSCWSFTIYFTFQTEGIEEMELHDFDYFNLLVGSPAGLKIYFQKTMAESNEDLVFYPHIAVLESYDKKRIFSILKAKIEALYGKSRNEIIGKGMIFFDWQYQDDPLEFPALFR